jgi:adenosylmethionine-8-amino-7-oxononanoate aminotransferase
MKHAQVGMTEVSETELSREAVVALDRAHVWHPYTPMQQYLSHGQPLVIARASGSQLFDKDGRAYLDGNASWWTSLLGHGHPRLLSALKRQADQLCHVSFGGITHEPAARLAQELCARAPAGLNKVFFCDNGSSAVEVALKQCLQYWQQNGRPGRTRMLALQHAFHGETLGAAALSGVEVFRRPFASVLMDCVHVPTDEQGFERAFAWLEQELRHNSDEIAACFVEPLVQGAGGMRMYSAEFLRRLREVTRELDIFLVVDEVFTGYGRSGAMWASEIAGIAPDVLCTAKGFSGGVLPMAATLSTQRLFDGFLGDPGRALYYGHTYAGHALGAAVALEVLEVYRTEKVIEQIAPKAARIAEAFAALAEVPGVYNPRSLGMIGALNLTSSGGEGYLERAGWRVYERALELGAFIRPLGNVVYVTPPLNISDLELEALLRILTQAVTEVCGSSPR